MTRRVSYATKFNLRDELPGDAKLSANDEGASSSSPIRVQTGCPNHDLVHTVSPGRFGWDDGHSQSIPIRRSGTHFSKDCADQSLALEVGSEPQPSTSNSRLAPTYLHCANTISNTYTVPRTAVPGLCHVQYTSTMAGTGSLGDPPVAPVASVSCTALASAIEFVQSLLDAPASDQQDVADLVSMFHEYRPGLLRGLGVKHRSELLCLFGTISDDRDARHYHSQCKGRIRVAPHGQGYWEEVIEVANEMDRLGHVFEERENYWLMRAYLECSRSTNSAASRDMARLFYSRILGQAQHHPSVLIPYLDIFLAHPSAPDFSEALDLLCTSIERQDNPHRDLVHLFWKVILTNGSVLPSAYKSRVLDLLLRRISHFKTTIRSAVPVSLNDLITAFAASIFPCYRTSALPPALAPWIMNCVRASLAQTIPIGERFDNLVLLSMWLLPRELSKSPTLGAASQSGDWRALIGLAILNRSLGSSTAVTPAQPDMQDVVRSFWLSWKDSARGDRPRGVIRAVTIVFLQVAIKVEDGPLFDGCMDYLTSQQAWNAREDGHETAQVEQLFGTVADGLSTFKDRTWMKLPSLLGNMSHNSSQQTRYLRRIFLRLAGHDAELAHQFYLHCLSHGIPVSLEASVPIIQCLVFQQRWSEVIPFLQDRRLNRGALEQVVEAILSVFRGARQESTTPIVAEAVGDALRRLYSTTYIPDRLKYPARFFFPVMITSGRSQQAIQLLEVFARNNLVMFTPRFYLRIIQTLLRRRQNALAVKTLELASSPQDKQSALADLRRKTIRGLIGNGALKLAAQVESTHPDATKRIPHDRLSYIGRCGSRSHKPTLLALLRLVSRAMKPPVRASVILATVQKLVQNRSFALARRLMKRSLGHLDATQLTAVGNVYLHAPVRYWNMRNGRLVRHVLRAKDFLVQEYGFTPDRVTVNIVIKTMLRWRGFMNTRMVRSLFDHLIRNGYPASEKWHTGNGVPFGTLPGGVTLDLSNIRPNMSFKRHVRPLYKMFIKEMFLRRDSRAARRVVGILKEEEVLATERKEHREQARRHGIVKKQRRRMLALAKGKSGGRESGG
ncbi:hypothetical protein P691DRAFT_800954 [Macrolepiota fuliginosa MF-IS2]|uniref:Uncharacterized protein n=1 Tax=Macrolepiota fuliginosa MF-IS2 TaxID=1400762 RepID=A0A9P5XC56_9AGAR|nr:hypothetical protein P691DRAFT_800954 [Macrolepiota fuliginosa MF-IS2]